MQISSATHVHGAQALRAPHSLKLASETTASRGTSAADELTLSDSARFVDQVRDLPEIRTERVAQLRAAIANGHYDTDAKLGVALDRFLDELG